MEFSLEEYPMLVALEGLLSDQRWSLERTVVLGRDSTCDIVIPDRQVSRYHARITPTKEGMNTRCDLPVVLQHLSSPIV